MAGQRKRKPIEGSDRSGKPLDADKDGVLDVVQEVEVIEQAGDRDSDGDGIPDSRDMDTPEFPSEAEEQAEFDKGIEEFNNHVKALVKNFFQQEVAELEERIRDLEMTRAIDPIAIVANAGGPQVAGPPKDVGVPDYDVPAYNPSSGDVEEYSPAHQGGDGTPWYRP